MTDLKEALRPDQIRFLSQIWSPNADGDATKVP
jgi:hypothetical protein